MAGNIGRARIKVSLLTGSPFAPQPKQEVAYYLTQDTIQPLNPVNITTLPSPLDGARCDEDLHNYDNFISDGDHYIDEATYTQTVTLSTGSPSESSSTTTTTTSTAAPQTVTGTFPVDASATARLKQIQDDLANQPQGFKDKFAAQKKFFTWVTSNAMFLESPPTPSFSEAPKIDNTPAWSLVALPRPGSATKVSVLTPFMRKSPPDRKSPIHWGVKMAQPIAQNQPFEIIFYYCQRDPALADQGPVLTPRFQFQNEDGSAIDLSLHNSIYVAIEFGISDAKDHFLMIFKSEDEPMLFSVVGTKAVLRAKFKGFNSSVVFNPSNKYFSVKIEAVKGSFLINSNLFPNTPWVVAAPPEKPIFIGKGNIGLYSGNVQAGFAMRPIQYKTDCFFNFPETQFTVLSPGTQINCSTALGGAGTVEQDRSYSDTKPDVQMVDAEKVNGAGVKTFIEAFSGESGRDGGVNRQIQVTNIPVSNSNATPGQDPILQGVQSFQTNVELEPSNVTQGGGYVVENGRSPYIWFVRCGCEPAKGGDPACAGDLCDISCDVETIDLNFNATSYNELTHNGTMRVLNKTSHNKLRQRDYRAFINRAVYCRIEAWWEIGVGHDPGAGQRQIFEGIMLGGTVETDADKEIIVFKLEDYMNALQGSKFILSVPYDGWSASLAVRDILLQTGFPDGKILGGDKPIKGSNLDNDYGIPRPVNGGQPQFLFSNGTSYKDGILKFAKLDFKTIYFDRFGNFHYDTMPGGIFGGDNAPVAVDFWSSAVDGNLFALGDLKRTAWNRVSLTVLVNDVYNVIQVLSVDKFIGGNRISAAMTYNAGISDPTAPGYLGYRKPLLISDAVLGDVGATNRYVRQYASRVFNPPISARFEIYGYTGIKPLDIIKLDGQRLRVLNMTTHLSAAENTYWQTIEGEWFFNSGKDQDPALNPPAGPVVDTSGSPGEQSTH